MEAGDDTKRVDERTVIPNGPRIRELRKQKYGSREALIAVLGHNSGISLRRLGDIERESAAVFPNTLHVIAEALGTSFEQLLLPLPGERGTSASALPAPPVMNRLFQLPAAVVDFTGRQDEFARMVERMRGGGAVGISALRGMGGIGKTSLAVKVAHEVKDNFPDAQLVLDLRGISNLPVTVVEAMARVIRDFHPDAAQLPETETELLPVYRSVLAGKRVLILLDNAKDEEQVRHLVTVPPPAGFLVTSRRSLALDGVESIRLGIMPSDEALELLRGIAAEKGTDDELRAVAELCGQLPLALRVAGDFLRLKEDWTTAQYLAALERERLRWLKGNSPDKDVEAVLKLSAAQLVRDNLELAEQWHLLHVFPVDFDIPAAAAIWEVAERDPLVHEDLSELTARSLILFDVTTRRYRLHDLMKPIAEHLFG